MLPPTTTNQNLQGGRWGQTARGFLNPVFINLSESHHGRDTELPQTEMKQVTSPDIVIMMLSMMMLPG